MGLTRSMKLLLALLLLAPGPKVTSHMTTTPTCGPPTAAAWRAVFDAQPILGDGMISVPGMCAFLTGDGVPRQPGPWAHSTITLVKAGKGHVVTPNNPGSQSPYQFIPDSADGSYHWFGPGVFADNTLWSLAPHNRVSDIWPYFVPLGTDLVRANAAPGQDPTYAGTYATPNPPAGVTWGAAMWYDATSKFVYIFGRSSAVTDGWTGYDAYLARVPVAGIANPFAWRYWGQMAPNWHGWTANPAQSTAILKAPRDGGVESTFTAWKDAGGWHLAARLGGAWGHNAAGVPVVSKWTSTNLLTGWNRQELAQVPEDAYLAQAHPELPLASGKLLVTYNQAGQESTFLEV